MDFDRFSLSLWPVRLLTSFCAVRETGRVALVKDQTQRTFESDLWLRECRYSLVYISDCELYGCCHFNRLLYHFLSWTHLPQRQRLGEDKGTRLSLVKLQFLSLYLPFIMSKLFHY